MDAFIEKAKQYTAIDELTPQLLRLFIQRIEIGERSKKHSRSAGQSVRIVYRDIGALDTPMREGDHAPHMAKQITEKEEIMRLLALKHSGGRLPPSASVPDNSPGSKNVPMGTIRKDVLLFWVTPSERRLHPLVF